MLTDKELAEIKDRCYKATPGPWIIERDQDSHVIRMDTSITSRGYYQSQHILRYEHGLYPEDGEQYQEAKNNAQFIVSSRADIPKLLAEIERLKEALKGIEWVAGSNTVTVLPDIKRRAKIALGGDTLDDTEA